jgi:hypothetical protein
MSSIQTKIRKEDIFDGADLPRISAPKIRGTVRLSPPDNTSTDYYWPSLSGKVLTVGTIGTFTGNFTITFTGNASITALADINTVTTTHISAEVQDGYLVLKCLHIGSNNQLRVVSGDAMTILGLTAYPSPRGISIAGDIDAQPANKYQPISHVGKLATKNSPLDDIVFNKSIGALACAVEQVLSDSDRMLATPVGYTVNTTNGVFSLNLDDEIYTGFTTQTDPGFDLLNFYTTFSDIKGNPVIVNNKVCGIASATYGTLTSLNSSFSSWGTADGKSIFGNNLHWSLAKATANITKIEGNTITATGANFITNRCLPDNTVLIAGATNNIPFNNNGEFLIDKVISENSITIKIKSTVDELVIGSATPSTLNPVLNVGEGYGTVSVLLGKFTTLAGKSTPIQFQLSPTPPDSTYIVTLPIGRTSRSIRTPEQTATAYRDIGGIIELGSKVLSSGAEGLKPRLNISTRDPGTLTNILETYSPGADKRWFRIYNSSDYGIFFTFNARWNGSVWTKDVVGLAAGQILLSVDGFKFETRIPANNATWTSWDGNFTLPVNIFNATSAAEIFNILKIGSTMIGTNDQADVPRLVLHAKDGAGTCLLLSLKDGIGYRETYTSQGLNKTINAIWINGSSVWVKDVANAPASRVLISTNGVHEYTQIENKASFGNIEWCPKTGSKNWSWDEDFLTLRGSSNALGIIDDMFRVDTCNNATIGVMDNAGIVDQDELGVFLTKTVNNGAFTTICSGNLSANFVGNFTIKIRARLSNNSQINNDGGEYPGVFIGFKIDNSANAPPPDYVNHFGLSAGIGSNFWNFRDSTNAGSVSTGVLCTDWIELTVIKINSGNTNSAYVYANGIYVSTVVVDSIMTYRPFITTKGTASIANTPVLLVDYIKYRLDRNNG